MTPAIFWVCTLVGLTGTILFFPLNLSDNATCLYEMHKQNVEPVPVDLAQAVHGVVLTNVADEISPEELAKQMNFIRMHNYMAGYLFWWWGSMGLLIIGIIKLYRRQMLPKLVSVSHNPKMGNHI